MQRVSPVLCYVSDTHAVLIEKHYELHERAKS